MFWNSESYVMQNIKTAIVWWTGGAFWNRFETATVLIAKDLAMCIIPMDA